LPEEAVTAMQGLVRVRRLVFFGWMDDAKAMHALDGRDDLTLVRLDLAGDDRRSWTEFSTAHGYQSSSRTELRAPWFADAHMFARAPGLLAVCSSGAGYDTIDVTAATRAGVLACNQAGANREAVAEHVIGYMLALSKRIAQSNRLMKRRVNLDRFRVKDNDIRGKTLGIVGLGYVGAHLAMLCREAFGMTVLAYDPYVDADRHTRCDALAGALASGRIAGAGLDVFEQEPPPPDHPLLAFDNVLASPHTAGITTEALANTTSSATDQWLDIFAGKAPRCLLNPEAWPH
jgi:D-3-phosphoglycerate dehydrogenase